MSSDKDRVFLTFQDSYWRKPCKWISEKVVNEFRRSCKDSDFVFLRFILTIRSGPTERGFIPYNVVGLSDAKVRDKAFYHFYQHCNMIFVNVNSKLSEPQIDLFYDEAVNIFC